MDESELEPDPRFRVPTILWLLLGLGVIVVFAAIIFLLRDHGAPHAFGPPPGAPPT